jgi:CRP-like cAMP-binding protein
VINTAFLLKSPLFHNLDEPERVQILIAGQMRDYKAGDYVFKEGDEGDGMFVVVKGSVRISKQSPTGEEALAVLEPHAFFGEMALIDFAPRAADAIAHEDSQLFFIPLKELRGLIETHHHLALKILFALCEVLAQRLRETNERYMSIFTIAQWGGGQQQPPGILPLP